MQYKFMEKGDVTNTHYVFVCVYGGVLRCAREFNSKSKETNIFSIIVY